MKHAQVWLRLIALAVIAAAATVFAAGKPAVCHQEVRSGKPSVVRLCRAAQWDDPAVLTVGVGLLLIVISAGIAEIKIGSFSVRGSAAPAVAGPLDLQQPPVPEDADIVGVLDDTKLRRSGLLNLLVRGCAYGLPGGADILITFNAVSANSMISLARATATNYDFPPTRIERVAIANELLDVAQRACASGEVIDDRVRLLADSEGDSPCIAAPVIGDSGTTHGVILAVTLARREIVPDQLAPPTDMLASHLRSTANAIAGVLDDVVSVQQSSPGRR